MDWMDVKALGKGESKPGGNGEFEPDVRTEPSAAELHGFTGDDGFHDPTPSALAAPEGLLDGLNDPQREACLHTEGPLMILAGPGSGKTRVITSRIVHLVTTCGIDPSGVLAITFTNKAAREMRERVERLLPGTRGLWISTFHSMCARILRRDIEVLGGYTRDFSIFDTADRNQLLKKIIKSAGLDRTQYRAGAVGGWLSNVKNGAQDDDPEERQVDVDKDGFDEGSLEKIRRRYEKAMANQNALDFDDLLLKVLEIFDAHPGVRDSYSHRFRHVMVDEYQDTNRVQYLLTRHLASAHGNLAACGDPDQSIYAWRGADVRNILDIEKDFPGVKTVKLEQNYRSSANILGAADAVIANNTARKQKGLWTEADEGDRLVVMECGDENDEGREIAHQLTSLHAAGARWADNAIFYRANFMQRALESGLRMAGIPYQVVGGLEFYGRREIKDLIAYLRLLVNPSDEAAFTRAVAAPARGVGLKSLETIAAAASERGVPILSALALDDAVGSVRGRGRKGLIEFGILMSDLATLCDGPAELALRGLLTRIDRTRWLADMDDGDGTVDREANIDELVAHAGEFDSLHPGGGVRAFLMDVALVSDVDGLEDTSDQVVLMTLHAAKGLEYSNVFIAGAEEELLPHARSLAEAGSSEAGLEEERRLCYVGMTRAMKRLFITHCRTRRFFGEDRWMSPSRFLDEIPDEFVEGQCPEDEEAEVLGTYEAGASQEVFAPGEFVEHDHFGPGRIEQLLGNGVNARAVVQFTHHGSKQLLLQYANLRRRTR
ncbi:MAG: DNA helicase-2/ATP-dependent DNA helicase PcrA [Planctomycetota bacterium]|jgi:DNA helicase-2/ATP-dependent DNA helicase PcrA